MIKPRWYAVYRGDDFIVQGTKEDCAKYLGVTTKTVCFMSTPAYHKRRSESPGTNHLIVIKVKDEEELE